MMMNGMKYNKILVLLFYGNFIMTSPVTIKSGGTGDTSLTAYAVVCGGTSTVNPLQSIASLGVAGQVLQSNGSAALPGFVNPPGKLMFVKTLTASSSSSLSFTSSDITSTYLDYMIIVNAIVPASNSCTLIMDWSTDNGSTYLNSNYFSGLNYLTYDSGGAFSNSNSTTTCPLSYTGGVTGDEGGVEFCAIISLQGLLQSASTGPCYYGQSIYFNATPKLVTAQIFGMNTGSANVNNIKFSLIAIPGGGSVNMTSGTISLYGFSIN